MIRLELITLNLLQFTNMAAPWGLFKTVITKENSNLRICIQYLGHHSKTTCRKSAKSKKSEVRILQKITLKHPILVSQINIIKSHGSRGLPKSRFTRKRKVISQFTGNKTSNSRFTKIPFTILLDCVKILDSAAPTRYPVSCFLISKKSVIYHKFC